MSVISGHQNGIPFFTPVEYLESDGNQFIDTEIYTTQDIDVRLDIAITNPISKQKAWANYFGICMPSELPDGAFYLRYGENYRAFRLSWNNYKDDISYPLPEASTWSDKIHIEFNRLKFVVNETKKDRNITITPNGPLYIFGANNNFSNQEPICRFYSAFIDNGKDILDLIPVRFNNENGITEGAMYDKLSKKMFRNNGTGQFIIGPDKGGLL